MSQTEQIHLMAGDEARVTALGATTVTVERNGKVDATIGNAIALRDEAIATLQRQLEEAEENLESTSHAFAEAVVDALFERLGPQRS